MKTKHNGDLVHTLAIATADILVPIVSMAVERALNARGVGRPVAARKGVHRRPASNGVSKNGHLTPSQQRTLTEMGLFNKGNGGSIFLLPSSHKKPAHSVARVANNLERGGLIKMMDDEQFVLTSKGKLQADQK